MKMDTDSKTTVYRVNGFDSICGSKSESKNHGKFDVKELISDGVLYHHESEFNSISSSKEFYEKMNTNPWQVDNIWAFSCLKCPECEFYSKEEENFQSHAMANHPGSAVLFGKYKVI